VLTPVFAKDGLQGGPGTLGFLMGWAGVGALAGAFYLAARKSVFGAWQVVTHRRLPSGRRSGCLFFLGSCRHHRRESMPAETRAMRKIMISITWLSAGVLTWLISVHLYADVLSPLLIRFVRGINTINPSIVTIDIVNFLFTNISVFILCFIFAFILSAITKSTKLRLTLYIVGVVAVRFYLKVDNLINYLRTGPEWNSGAMTSFILEFAAILLIVPIFAIAGNKVGGYLRMHRGKGSAQ
jgi:hypothetical protein